MLCELEAQRNVNPSTWPSWPQNTLGQMEHKHMEKRLAGADKKQVIDTDKEDSKVALGPPWFLPKVNS